MSMIRTLLLASTLVSTATSLKNFTGVGTVECPQPQDTTTDPEACEFYFTINPLFCTLECPDAIAFVGDAFTLPANATTLFLPCDCTQVINCPDACTFTVDTNSTASPPVEPGDYVGPGYLTCDSIPNLLSCNISIIEDCDLDVSTCGIQDFGSILDSITTGKLTIPLLCSCVQAKECPCTFTAMEIDTNTTSFEGVGTVVCPGADFAQKPCFPLDISGDGLCSDCLDFDIAPFLLYNQLSEVRIPLPCECLKVAGCPSTCTFLDSIVAEQATFEGAGRLTCPIDDYLSSPCIPLGECDGAGFSCIATALSTLNVTSTTISIDVPCDCVRLPDCSAKCTFEPMPQSLPGSPSASNTTLAPATTKPAAPTPMTMTTPAPVSGPQSSPMAPSAPVSGPAPKPDTPAGTTPTTPTKSPVQAAPGPSGTTPTVPSAPGPSGTTPTVPATPASGSTLLIFGTFSTMLLSLVLVSFAW